MKICLVSDIYYPHIGGVPEHIYNLKLNLNRMGHEVKILTASFGNDAPFTSKDIVRIGRGVKIMKSKSFSTITVGHAISWKVKEFLDRENFDIIHTHGPLAPVLPYLALKHSKAFNFATFHSAHDESIGYIIFEPILERYFKKIHGLIAVSEVAKKSMEQYFSGDYRIIPNGVDTQVFNPQIPVREELRARKPIVLFVGRLEPRKGLKYLLQAFPRVIKEIPDATLLVVGKGYLDVYYKRFVAEKLKDRVVFVGYVSGQELPSYYASCDIYCSPAIGLESFGIVLLEAMACSRPVVCSDIDGYRKVMTDGAEGFFFKAKDPDSLSQRLITLLKGRELRVRMGEAGRKTAIRYDWQKVTKQVEEFYLEVIERERRQNTVF